MAEKTEELRDAFDQAVKEIHPETKISRRHVEVSVKSAELHAVLLGPKEVEEVQATMGGLECCLKSGEGGGFSQRKKRVLIVCIKFSWHKVMPVALKKVVMARFVKKSYVETSVKETSICSINLSIVQGLTLACS